RRSSRRRYATLLPALCNRQLALDHAPLADERFRHLRVLGVDLARQAMAGKDAIGNQPRCLAIPDPVATDYSLRVESVEPDPVLELTVEGLVRAPLRDQHDRVGLPRLLVRLLVVHVRRREQALLD